MGHRSQVLLERLATGAHRHKTSEIGHCLPSQGLRGIYAHAQYTSVIPNMQSPEPNCAEGFANHYTSNAPDTVMIRSRKEETCIPQIL